MAEGIPALDPLSYWAFRDLSGTSAENASGGTRAVLVNGAAFDINGIRQGGVALDGVNDLVSVAHSRAYSLDSGAISLWFNPSALGRDQGLISKNSEGLDSGGGFTLLVQADGSLIFELESASATFTILSDTVAVAGSWNNVVVSWGAYGMQLWLNGELVGSNSYAGGLGASSDSTGADDPLVFGASTQNAGDRSLVGASNFFGGLIDEAVAFSRQPTPAEITVINLNGSVMGNADPVANQDGLSVLENEVTSYIGSVLTNDADGDADPLSVFAVNGSTEHVGMPIAGKYGTLTVLADGTYSYAIDASLSKVQTLRDGEAVTESFEYTVTDGSGGLAGTVLVITINGQNDAPVVVSETRSIKEDAGNPVLAGNVLNNDRDLDGGILTVADVNGVAGNVGAAVTGTYGALTVNADGTYAYALDNGLIAVQALGAGQSVTDVFTYLVSDGQGGSATASLTVTVNGRNDAPTAVADTGDVLVDTAPTTSGNVLGNDSDVEGDILVVSAVNGSAARVGVEVTGGYGTLVLNSDGTYAYAVNAAAKKVIALASGQTATDTFTYRVSDGAGGNTNTTLVITVTGANDAPVVVSETRSIKEDAGNPVLAGNVLNNDRDLDGGILTVADVNGVAGNVGAAVTGTYGALTVNADGTYAYALDNGLIAVQALGAGQSVTDVFTYLVSDGQGGSATASLTVTVNGRNDAPTAVAATTGAVLEDRVLSASGSVMETIQDIDAGDTLNVSQVNGQSANVGVAITGHYGSVIINADGSYTYSLNNAAANVQALNAGETVSDTFRYRVVDASGAGVTNTLVVSIGGAVENRPPTATDDNVSTNEGTSVTINVLGNDTDADGDVLLITDIDGQAVTAGAEVFLTSGGTATLNADGTITYNPADNANGAMTFNYTVSDGNGAADTAAISIAVTPVAAPATIHFGGSAPLAPLDAGDVSVSSVAAQRETVSTVQALADGGYVVAWSGFGVGQGYGDTFLQRYSAAGEPVGSAIKVNTTNSLYEWSPTIAATGDGGYVVAWQTETGDGSGRGISAQRFAADGSLSGGEFRVNTTTASAQEAPVLTELSNGGFLAVWQSEGQDGSGAGIYGQRFAADGTKDGIEFSINTTTAGSQFTPAVATLPDGGFVVSWVSDAQDGSGFGIFAQRFSVNGVAFGTEFAVNGSVAGDQQYPDIAVLSDGGYVITWSSAGGQDGDGWGVFGQRYAASGEAVGAEFLVNTYVTSNQYLSSVIGLPDGGFVITWASAGQDGSGLGMFGQRYDSSGNRVGSEMQLNASTAGNQFNDTNGGIYPLALTVDGTLVQLFTDAQHVFMRRFDTLTQQDGQEDQAFGLAVRVSAGASGDSVIQVVLSGLPVGSVLSSGTSNSEGTSWTFAGAPPPNLTMIPPANYNGTFTLTVTATTQDGTETTTAMGTQTVTVNAVNDAPVAVADAAATSAGTPVIIDVLANDTDIDGDSLVVTQIDGLVATVGVAVTLMEGAQATLNADGTVTYVSAPGASGPASFNYTMSDGNGGEATGTVNVGVAAVAGPASIQFYEANYTIGRISSAGSIGDFVSGQANGPSSAPAVSQDSRYVSFYSDATNLVADDTNGVGDIFRKDLATGETLRVTTSATGSEANGATLAQSAISADGRYVAFASDATNLVDADANNHRDIFLKDLTTGAVARVSTNAAGEEANGDSQATAISAEGRYVFFISTATNLVPGAASGAGQLYRKDMQTGQLDLVSTDAAGVPGDASTSEVSISADGRMVLFTSYATNLVAGDTNGVDDIFLKDMVTGRIIRVSTDTNGDQAIGEFFGSDFVGSYDGTLSADGRYVTFTSFAGNLVADDTNGSADIFRKDLVTGDIIRVSTDAFGGEGNAHSFAPSISADGRFVTFYSAASNFVVDDTYGRLDVFRKDLLTGDIVRIPIEGLGGQPFGDSIDPIVSRHGRFIFFVSDAPNLYPNDTNETSDIFLVDESPVFQGTSDEPGYANESGVHIPIIVSPTDPGDVVIETVLSGLPPGSVILASQIVTPFTSNADGTVWTFAGSPDLGALLVAPTSYSGTFDLVVTATTQDGSATHTVTASRAVTITASNSPPVIVSDATATSEGLPVTIDVLANDTDINGDALTITRLDGQIASIGQPLTLADGAEVTHNADGTVTYTPAPGSSGLASFSYAAVDGQGGLATGSVTVDIAAVAVPASISFAQGIGTILLASSSTAGDPGNNSSSAPSISSDGRYVTFASSASNLVAGDTNNASDVFVRDLQTGSVTLVSASTSGVLGDSYSSAPSISSDGRYVSFVSSASNLVAGDTNNASDVFVRDLQTGSVILGSVSASGVQGNTQSYEATISSNGRYVVFSSPASNLVAGDINGRTDVFLRDLELGTTLRVSTDGFSSVNTGEYHPLVSDDGRYLYFYTPSSLVAGDTGRSDVFVRDVQSGTITRLSTDAAGTQANGDSSTISISSDGRYIAFQSFASNLVPGDTNGALDIFVRDLQTGSIQRVSISFAGEQANASSRNASLSADGRYLTFSSSATNLVAGDTNGQEDVFARDLQTGVVTLVSTSVTDAQGNGTSTNSSISADGRFLAFRSYASNMIASDTNALSDIFVRDLQPNFSGSEDQTDIRLPITITLGAEGDTLSEVVLSGLPAGSILSSGAPNTDGTSWTFVGAPPANLTMTPPANFNGTFILTVTATTQDGAATATSNATHDVVVAAVNDAPVAFDDAEIAFAGKSIIIDVRGNDFDIDGDTLSITHLGGLAVTPGGASVAVTGGTASLNPDGTITYTPGVNTTGNQQFSYTLSDGTLNTTATVDVTISENSFVAILATDPAITGAAEVHYLAIFSQPMSGVSASSFTLAATGVTGALITGVEPVPGSGDTRFMVTVDTGSGEGALSLAYGSPALNVAAAGSYGAGLTPLGMTTGDFNQDGNMDLAVAAHGQDLVNVLFGNGDGTFQPAVSYSSNGAGPYLVATADVDGDGDLDLAVANRDAGNVTVLRNDGTGVFGSPTTSPSLGMFTRFVDFGDFNGDGRSDMLAANEGSNNVSVFINDGSGGFLSATLFAAGTLPATARAVDINNDGKVDIVTSNFVANTLSILLGNGDGTFQAATSLLVGAGPASVDFGDLNGDGFVDLVSANQVAGSISVLLGAGNGAFQTQQVYNMGSGPFSVLVTELNGDELLDVATVSNNGGGMEIRLGNGDGTLGGLTAFANANALFDLVSADFNGDSSPDLAITNGTGAAVNIWINPPYAPGPAYTINRAAAPVILDLDNNGVTLASGVTFDYDGDGVVEMGGWAAPGDAFLALDRNGDGVINSISEISFVQDKPGAITDLEGLAAYDTNSDGQLSAADARFADFLVWDDINQNGVSEASELRLLSYAGIVSVGLTPIGESAEDSAGNIVYGYADVKLANGSYTSAADVSLAYDEIGPIDQFHELRGGTLEMTRVEPAFDPVFSGGWRGLAEDPVVQDLVGYRSLPVWGDDQISSGFPDTINVFNPASRSQWADPVSGQWQATLFDADYLSVHQDWAGHRITDQDFGSLINVDDLPIF